MSTVFVHVGQCGNQIGSTFWEKAWSSKIPSSPFFDEFGKARCILIDSEPKAISSILKSSARLGADIYRPQNVVSDQQSGRGNNWAFGYHGGHSSEGSDGSLSAKALEALRREVERIDAFTGVVLAHSTSGGTGSGLGSRLVEQIADAHGAAPFRLSCTVLPSLTGDSCLQSFNSILTLAHLQRFVDAALVFDNDTLLASAAPRSLPALPSTPSPSSSSFISASASSSGAGPPPLSVADLNAHVVDALFGVMAPWTSSSYKPMHFTGSAALPLYRPFQAFDFVDAVAPLPSLKFVELYHTVPVTTSASLFSRSIKSSLPLYDCASRPCRTAFRLCLLRGPSTSASTSTSTSASTSASASVSALAWDLASDASVESAVDRALPLYAPDWAASSRSPVQRAPCFEKLSVTTCLNRTRIVATLEILLQRAKNMFGAKAYVHWYTRYGCEVSDFEEAFEVIQEIIENYQCI